MNYWGQQVEMDGQGRLLIPQLLRENGADQGRSGSAGQPDLSGSAQPGSVPQGDRDEKFTTDDEKTLDELGI